VVSSAGEHLREASSPGRAAPQHGACRQRGQRDVAVDEGVVGPAGAWERRVRGVRERGETDAR